MASLTLAEAAAQVGVNRSTLLRSIKNGRLSGTRDDLGVWRLDPSELFRVFQPVSAEAMPKAPPQDAQADAQVAALLAQLAEMRERLSETREDRDAWREQAQRLALGAPKQEPKPRRWWQRR